MSVKQLTGGDYVTWIVDPNKVNNEGVNLEDLVTYVKLVATPKNRSVISTDGTFATQGSSEVVEFISSTSQDGGKYLTTNYLNTGNGQKTVEGFGIRKIDIALGGGLVPVVDIEFEDSRGSGMYNNYEYESEGFQFNNSNFNVFFQLPYPNFNLTVKGFYGKAVSYCLTLRRWSTTFDANSNSFIIKASFIANTYSWLSDITLTEMTAATASPIGRKFLEKYDVIPYAELITSLSRITVTIEQFKAKNINVNKLKGLNTLIELYKKLQFNIGTSVNAKQEGFQGASFNTTFLKTGKDYTFIRDIGVLNNASNYGYLNFVQENQDILESITEYSKDNKITIAQSLDLEPTTIGNYKLNDDFLTAIKAEILKFEPGYDVEYFISDDIINKLGLKVSSSHILLNYYKVRKDLSDLISKIEDKRKVLEEEVNIELNAAITSDLGFNPTIREVFTILLNNVEAYVDLIHNYAIKAESQSIFRTNKLANVQTDLNPNDSTVYPFPECIGLESSERVWIGDIVKGDESYFPEIELVDLVLNSISTINTLESKNNVANSVSKIIPDGDGVGVNFNVVDNDYALLKTFSLVNGTANEVAPDFAKQLNDRFSTLLFSKTEKKLSDIAKLDARYVYDSISNLNRNIIKQYDSTTFAQNIIDNGVDKLSEIDGYDVVNDPYIIVTPSFNNNDGIFSKFTKNVADLIEKKNIKLDTLLNCKKDFEYYSIKNNSYVLDWSTQPYFANNKNLISNYTLKTSSVPKLKELNTNHFLLKYVSSLKLFATNNLNSFSKRGDVTYDDFNNYYIDGSTYAHFYLDGYYGDYEIEDEGYILREFVFLQNKFAKLSDLEQLYIYLTSLFYNPKYSLQQHIDDFTELLADKSRKIIIPTAYYYWIGSLISETYDYSPLNTYSDGRIYTDNQIYSNSNNYSISQYKSLIETTAPILNIGVIDKIKQDYYDFIISGAWDRLIETHISWAENLKTGVINQDLLISDTNKILEFLTDITSIDVVAPYEIVNQSYSNNNTSRNKYLTIFKSEFDSLMKSGGAKDPKVKASNKIIDKDLKMDAYQHFKGVYDKWIGGSSGKLYSSCNPFKRDDSRTLIDHFQFLDRAWADIGDKLVLNPDGIIKNLDEPNMNLYAYIGRILQASKLDFHVIPSYVNYKNIDEVAEMWKPTLNLKDVSEGSTFLCVYVGGNSKVLDLGKNSHYLNDGFDLKIGKMPKNFTNRGQRVPQNIKDLSQQDRDKYNMVAFRVANGDHNQGIFKDIAVSQEEMRETFESIQMLGKIVDNKGGTQRFFKGSDLYNLMSTRSYMCTVISMGNMLIQPMMYFQLDNVPFFKGAYLIKNVSHTITPHNIETTFTGARMPRFTYPIVDEITSYSNISFSEYIDDAEFAEIVNQNADRSFGNSMLSNALNGDEIAIFEDLIPTTHLYNKLTMSQKSVKTGLYIDPDVTIEQYENGLKDYFSQTTIPTYGVKNSRCLEWVQKAINANNIKNTTGFSAWNFLTAIPDEAFIPLAQKDPNNWSDSILSKKISNTASEVNTYNKDLYFIFGTFRRSPYKREASDTVADYCKPNGKMLTHLAYDNLTTYSNKFNDIFTAAERIYTEKSGDNVGGETIRKGYPLGCTHIGLHYGGTKLSYHNLQGSVFGLNSKPFIVLGAVNLSRLVRNAKI